MTDASFAARTGRTIGAAKDTAAFVREQMRRGLSPDGRALSRTYRVVKNANGKFSVLSTIPGKPARKAYKDFRTARAAKNYIGRVRNKLTGTVNPFNAAGIERRAKLYQALTDAADRGAPMPSNASLMKLIGGDQLKNALSTLCDHLRALRRSGHIKIVQGATQYDRYVIIASTGKRTDWQIRTHGKDSGRKGSDRKSDRPASTFKAGRLAHSRALAGGYSDLVIWGPLADAVRFCRQRGDVVHRDEKDKTVILINGRPKDPKERQAWHQRMAA